MVTERDPVAEAAQPYLRALNALEDYLQMQTSGYEAESVVAPSAAEHRVITAQLSACQDALRVLRRFKAKAKDNGQT